MTTHKGEACNTTIEQILASELFALYAETRNCLPTAR
jgi:hypothetical protein